VASAVVRLGGDRGSRCGRGRRCGGCEERHRQEGAGRRRAGTTEHTRLPLAVRQPDGREQHLARDALRPLPVRRRWENVGVAGPLGTGCDEPSPAEREHALDGRTQRAREEHRWRQEVGRRPSRRSADTRLARLRRRSAKRSNAVRSRGRARPLSLHGQRRLLQPRLEGSWRRRHGPRRHTVGRHPRRRHGAGTAREQGRRQNVAARPGRPTHGARAQPDGSEARTCRRPGRPTLHGRRSKVAPAAEDRGGRGSGRVVARQSERRLRRRL
jgi:hypothetical protein